MQSKCTLLNQLHVLERSDMELSWSCSISARAVKFILLILFCFLSTEYRILGKKGEGTFSEVLKVQDIRDGTYFACKKMKQRYER